MHNAQVSQGSRPKAQGPSITGLNSLHAASVYPEVVVVLCVQVATLQLELEFVHGSLEEEVLDVAYDSLAARPPATPALLGRTGTSDEVCAAIRYTSRILHSLNTSLIVSGETQ